MPRTRQLARLQLAPIKKLEGSRRMYFLLSSHHPRMTVSGGAGGKQASSRAPQEDLGRNNNAPGLSTTGPGVKGRGAAAARANLGSSPWEAQTRRLTTGALIKTSSPSWQGRTLPTLVWASGPHWRGWAQCGDIPGRFHRPQCIHLCGVWMDNTLSAHTPFAERQAGLLNFLWPHLAWRKSRGQRRRRRPSHLARPEARERSLSEMGSPPGP